MMLLRPDLEHELVVALVGAVLPIALGLDDHADAVAYLGRGHHLHGRAEVAHVELAAQLLGHAGAQELDHEALALLLDIHADLVARQADDDAARAIVAAAEIDVAQRLRAGVLALGKVHGSFTRGSDRSSVEREQQCAALDLGAVSRGLAQIEDDAGPVTGLGDVGRTQIALVDLDHGPADGVADAGQVDRDARRRLHRETGRHGRQRLAQLDANNLRTGLLDAADRFDRVVGPGGHGAHQTEARGQTQRARIARPGSHLGVLHQCVHRPFS
jgi:hypothetical protein